jgi:hypothetical protein
MSFFKKKKEVMTGSALTRITRGLHHAASTTNTMVAQQYVRLLEQFFDRDGDAPDAPFKAKMVEVQLDEKHSMLVPLISLVAPRGIALDTMRVEMSVKIDGTEAKKATSGLDNATEERDGFQVSITTGKRINGERRDPDEVEIVMEFRAGDPPEGIMRIIDEYTNLIAPAEIASEPPPAPQPEEKSEAASS